AGVGVARQVAAPGIELEALPGHGRQGDDFVAGVVVLGRAALHGPRANGRDVELAEIIFRRDGAGRVEEVVNLTRKSRVGAGVAGEDAVAGHHQFVLEAGGEAPRRAVAGVVEVPDAADALDAQVHRRGDSDVIVDARGGRAGLEGIR